MCETDGSVDNILAIHSLNPRSLLVAYYAFVNRVTDGPGVNLEARWTKKAPSKAEGS